MGFLSVLPYAPATSPLPDTDGVVAASGVQVPGYKLPVRAGFSAERPRKVRQATIPNDNASREDDAAFHRGMLYDSLV